ncbi:hypothetical protein LG943_02960 [Streptomonospora sp. S1-112]|uniref:Uncharacterized protein n=1 Tax=Streptomonospora mangrovi TaxID=2883123 RepID=A0A9X3SE08_9ACTN|nr:hypothetical protein [Streptomonospora mangrovi]MDA0563295.1 hypothetical protein [Streptomonospora mangrovi]
MPSTDSAAQERTRAYARVIGPYVAVFTAVIAVRLPDLAGLTGDLFAQPLMVWMLGALMLAGGLTVIGGHRHWRGPLAVAVSLFGWFVALRGLALIAAPGAMEAGVQATMDSPAALAAARVFFGALALVGVLLAWGGWSPRRAAPAPGGAAR